MDTLESMIDMVKDAVGDSGTCSDETAIKAINQARRALWNKATTRNNCEYFCIQCVDGCITLPSRYEKILLAWADGRPMSLSDEWYQSYNGVGLFRECDSCHLGMQEIGGDHVVFRNYTKEPYLLAVMAEAQTDEGKTVSFEVIDQYNSHHTMTSELGRSPKLIAGDRLIRSVVRATKPRTDGRVRLYAINTRLNEKLLLSVFAPWDVNPSFRRFGIGKTKATKLTIFAQKKCFDLVSRLELVEYNSEAIYFALLAISARENRKPDEYIKNLSLAVQEVKKDEEFQDLNVPDPLNFLGERVESLDGSFFLDSNAGLVIPRGCGNVPEKKWLAPSTNLSVDIDLDTITFNVEIIDFKCGKLKIEYFIEEMLMETKWVDCGGTYSYTTAMNPTWFADQELKVSAIVSSDSPRPWRTAMYVDTFYAYSSPSVNFSTALSVDALSIPVTLTGGKYGEYQLQRKVNGVVISTVMVTAEGTYNFSTPYDPEWFDTGDLLIEVDVIAQSPLPAWEATLSESISAAFAGFIPPVPTMEASIDINDLVIDATLTGGTYGAYKIEYFAAGNLIHTEYAVAAGTYTYRQVINPEWWNDGVIEVEVKFTSVPNLPAWTETLSQDVPSVLFSFFPGDVLGDPKFSYGVAVDTIRKFAYCVGIASTLDEAGNVHRLNLATGRIDTMPVVAAYGVYLRESDGSLFLENNRKFPTDYTFRRYLPHLWNPGDPLNPVTTGDSVDIYTEGGTYAEGLDSLLIPTQGSIQRWPANTLTSPVVYQNTATSFGVHGVRWVDDRVWWIEGDGSTGKRWFSGNTTFNTCPSNSGSDIIPIPDLSRAVLVGIDGATRGAWVANSITGAIIHSIPGFGNASGRGCFNVGDNGAVIFDLLEDNVRQINATDGTYSDSPNPTGVKYGTGFFYGGLRIALPYTGAAWGDVNCGIKVW